jgi:hypothetical protein
MRFLAFALACLFATSAAAQTNSAEVERAASALSAIWRPVEGAVTATTINSACIGAVEEIAAIEAALPPVLTPDSLQRVRGLRGMLIIPAGDVTGWLYIFPPASLSWVTPGMGRVAVVSEADGFLALQDGAGESVSLQLGRAGQWPMMRIRQADGAMLNYVGCAPAG